MTDYRTVLERDLARVGPAPFGLDDVARRRDRKRRNQRIAAGVVGIAVFVAAVWVVTTGPFDQSQTEGIPGGAGTGPAVTGPPVVTGPAVTGAENPEPPPLVEPAHIGTVTLSGAGCGLEIVAEPIPAGPGRLTVVNETNRRVSFELWRLRSRSSFAQLEAFVEAYDAENGSWPVVPGPGVLGETAAPGLLLRRGWLEREVGPGASGTITENFTTGDAFAVVCLEPSRPDLLPGQPYTPFAVVGPIVVP